MNSLSRSVALMLVVALATPMLALRVASAGGGEDSVAADKDKSKALLEAARKRTPDEVKVNMPWAPGFDPLNKSQVIKRFGRLIRNNVWDNLEMLCGECIKDGDIELYAMAKYYLAVLAGKDILSAADRDKAKKETFAILEEAIDLGFRNPFLIEQSEQLLPLHDLPAFKAKMQTLKNEFHEKRKKLFQANVDKELALSQKLDTAGWTPQLMPLEGESFWKTDQPMLVVVSRIHHDGFNKLIPLIHEAYAKYGQSLTMGVVFYQYRLDDKARIAQTRDYVAKLGLKLPCAITGRAEFKKLKEGVLLERHKSLAEAGAKKSVFNPFQPITLCLDAKNCPVYLGRGALYKWQFDYIVETFTKALTNKKSAATKQPAEAKKASPENKSTGEKEARRSTP